MEAVVHLVRCPKTFARINHDLQADHRIVDVIIGDSESVQFTTNQRLWLVVWNIFDFSIYWEFHHPN